MFSFLFRIFTLILFFFVLVVQSYPIYAAEVSSVPQILVYDAPIDCDNCNDWNQEQSPFLVYGNTYYVGVHGLSAILISTSAGLILIDGALPQSAFLIEKNIRALGFRVEDIKFILNSHAHLDHAGGIAALQRLSHARVLLSEKSAEACKQGEITQEDPQYLTFPRTFPAIQNIETITDGYKLKLGDVELTAHLTPGHTLGGTTWSWLSCEKQHCLNVVYADSLTPISSDGFYFSKDKKRVSDFKKSIQQIAHLPCDILLAAHPDSIGMDELLLLRKKNPLKNPFIDQQACRYYADSAQKSLIKRLKREKEIH